MAYEVQLSPDVQGALESLAARPLRSFADFIDTVRTDPYVGGLYHPGGDLRIDAIDDGELLVVWLVPDDQRVVILRLVWPGDEPGGS